MWSWKVDTAKEVSVSSNLQFWLQMTLLETKLPQCFEIPEETVVDSYLMLALLETKGVK